MPDIRRPETRPSRPHETPVDAGWLDLNERFGSVLVPVARVFGRGTARSSGGGDAPGAGGRRSSPPTAIEKVAIVGVLAVCLVSAAVVATADAVRGIRTRS